jgi:hypothetical protein
VENRGASLSSAATTLDELVTRITETADAAQAAGDESLAHDLYEVERGLRSALRRLEGVVRRTR